MGQSKFYKAGICQKQKSLYKNMKIQKVVIGICPVIAEMLYQNRQTFHNSQNHHKNGSLNLPKSGQRPPATPRPKLKRKSQKSERAMRRTKTSLKKVEIS